MSSEADRSRLAGTNQDDVRRHNLGALLTQVHRAGPLSRAELTTRMALNRSTIAGLVAELEALGATEQVAPEGGRRSAGRPSPVVRVDAGGPFVVAADVGVGRIQAARVCLGGEVAERAAARLPDRPDPVEAAATLARLVEELTASASPRGTLVGVGVGVPGVIGKTGGVIRVAPNLDWHDVAFSELVAAHLDPSVPVLLDNDANLGALAEHLHGVGVGVDDLVYVIGLVGVGAGFIVGGAPLLGAGGYAGEIGHMRHQPDGEPCHCGNRGCWETEVGAVAIARAISAPTDQVTQLDTVLDAFDSAPPALREIGEHLGVGLASAVNLFNPQLVVLGGYLRSLYRLVRDDVDAALEARALRAPSQSVTVSLPGLGDDSVLLGAAEMAFAPVFADPVAILSCADEAGGTA